MQPLHEHSRINLADLKSQIVKKIGTEGSKQYLYCLNKFLSSKMNKIDFNKLCLKILGRDNIPLHNQLVRSILKNACTAKISPPANQRDDDFSKRSVLQNGSVLSNGIDLLPVSPKKARSVVHNLRSSVDRRIVLGQHKTNALSRQTSYVSVLERFKDSYNVSRSEEDQPCRVNSEDHIVRDEGRESFAGVSIEAPFGVKLGSQRVDPSKYMGTSNAGELLGNFTLWEQMEQIALRHGLEGVSPECASILNHGLDSYLKGIIRSCTEQLVGTSSDRKSKNSASFEQLSYRKHINGVKPGYDYLGQNSMRTMEVQEQHSQCSVSLQNLRVAMELNPGLLGEGWPWLLERISAHSFDE